MDERQILDDLERQSRPHGYDGADNDMLNAEQEVDLSDVKEDLTWVEGNYPFRIVNVEYKISKERIDERTGAPAGNQPYLQLSLLVFAGPCAGEELDDRVMLEGKGKVRFLNLIRSVDMYDEVEKKFRGRYADLIGCEMWGEVANREETFKGEKRKRSGIAFTGYRHISKFEVPAEDDPFAEAGVVTEKPAEEPVRPLSPRTATEPSPRVQEVVEEVLETMPVSNDGAYTEEELVAAAEVREEQVHQPVAAARPAAAAARPVARPVARAAGEKPPF